MAVFERKIASQYLVALEALASRIESNWWKDLLNSWAPAGTPLTEQRQLRLAVRKDYLNFYHRGQSVAKVSFASGAKPQLHTHIKYAVAGSKAQAYGRLADEVVHFDPKHHPNPVPYLGKETLQAWTIAARAYKGAEKNGIEDIVANNNGVIDLEMGLPAWETQAVDSGQCDGVKFAPRMDLVALEPAAGKTETRLVFWEAKTVRDARLRSSTSKVEVVEQLKLYEVYLSRAEHQKAVLEAYRNVCRILMELHLMAAKCSETLLPELAGMVTDVGDGTQALSLDTKPRLLIFAGRLDDHSTSIMDDFEKQPQNWEHHFGKLTAAVPTLYSHDTQHVRLTREALALRKN